MELEKSCYSFKDFVDDGSDIFKSLIDEDSDNLSRNQCTIQIDNNMRNSFVLDSSYQQRVSENSIESEKPVIIEQQQLIKKPYSRQFHNRLELLLQRSRPQRKLEKSRCSLDTCVILIKILNSKRIYRLTFNFYIIFNILFRGMCLGITIYQTILYSLDNKWTCWWCFGCFAFSRMLFCLSISKLLSVGEQTKDKSIKMVYETYLKSFEDIQVKIRQLERENSSLVRRNQEDEDQFFKITQEMLHFQRWLFCLKTQIIFIPPELSFLQLRKQSCGFFQVQNFIMKSIEMYFFMPAFLYFITVFKVQDVGKIVIFDFTQNQIQNIFIILVIIDVALFIILTFLLLYFGNKKQRVRPN